MFARVVERVGEGWFRNWVVGLEMESEGVGATSQWRRRVKRGGSRGRERKKKEEVRTYT